MTNATNNTGNNATSESSISAFQRKVSTYKQKRIFWPIVAGISVLFLTAHPFIAFVSYIIFGLFYDWTTFKVDGRKDSVEIPPHQLQKEQITGKQYDNLNRFLIKLRQAAFALSVSAAAFSLLFFKDTDYQFTFVAVYCAVTTFAIFWGVRTEEIVYPYVEARTTTFPYPQVIPYEPIAFSIANEPTAFHIANESPAFSIAYEPTAFEGDSYNRFDVSSSAAYWPGGILDPNRDN